MGVSFSESGSGGPANTNNLTGRWDEQVLTKNGFAVDHDEGMVYIIEGVPVTMPPGHVSVKAADAEVWAQVVANPDGEIARLWRGTLAGLMAEAQPNPNKKK